MPLARAPCSTHSFWDPVTRRQERDAAFFADERTSGNPSEPLRTVVQGAMADQNGSADELAEELKDSRLVRDVEVNI